MVINHNMPSLNQHRIMKTNVKNTEDSSRKLSSGYRINEDADDAAGLCISETMRHQVRGPVSYTHLTLPTNSLV